MRALSRHVHGRCKGRRDILRRVLAPPAPSSTQNYKGTLYVADLTLSMQATVNSYNCLMVEGSCQPIGGYSVWATMPPMAPLLPNVTDKDAVSGSVGRL